MRGHLTEKADVFAFGVVALEVLSGRSNSDESVGKDKVYLLEWVCTEFLCSSIHTFIDYMNHVQCHTSMNLMNCLAGLIPSNHHFEPNP